MVKCHVLQGNSWSVTFLEEKTWRAGWNTAVVWCIQFRRFDKWDGFWTWHAKSGHALRDLGMIYPIHLHQWMYAERRGSTSRRFMELVVMGVVVKALENPGEISQRLWYLVWCMKAKTVSGTKTARHCKARKIVSRHVTSATCRQSTSRCWPKYNLCFFSNRLWDEICSKAERVKHRLRFYGLVEGNSLNLSEMTWGHRLGLKFQLPQNDPWSSGSAKTLSTWVVQPWWSLRQVLKFTYAENRST